MGTPGPQKIRRYGIAFKLRAVQLSQQPGVLSKDVAESLCIHPFMLSRWRKEVREGELVGKPSPIDSASVANRTSGGRRRSPLMAELFLGTDYDERFY